MCMLFDPETLSLEIYPKEITGELPKLVCTMVATATFWIDISDN